MLDYILQAIVEPRRRDILDLVRDDERSAGEIAGHFPDVTRPAISQHLSVLVDAGLLSVRQEGRRRLYQLRPEGFRELRVFIDDYWDRSLSQLKRVAEQEQRRLDNESEQT